jgi:HlyD family secretion protein
MPIDRQTSSPSGDHSKFALLATVAIAVVFAGFGWFAAVVRLDSAAIAAGRVTAETSTKPLQHLEGGIVREILVKEAQKVKVGDVLFRLEPTEAQANVDMIKKQIDASRALEIRLLAERDGAAKLVFPADLRAHASIPETAVAIADQERQFTERRTTLDNATQILNARLIQTSKELTAARAEERSIKDQIENLNADIKSANTLFKQGLYPKPKLMASQRERSRLEGQLGGAQREIARLNGVADEAKLQIAQGGQKMREEAGQLLTDVRARMSDASLKLNVADDVVNRIEIRAPQNGIVQGLKVHTPGAVVRPGESLADLVPSGDKLVMAVHVSPLDIDNVATGQKAEVRFPGFASRGFPTIMGRVERAGADVMIDENTKEPYYLARIEIDPATVPAELSQRLQPGMPADVLITTGERTLFQYLIGPLTDLIAKSMREI